MVMRTKNSKICIKSMIFSVIILLLHGNGISAQNVWVREHEPARLMISEERLEREIGFLSDSLCQGRGTGTGGGSAAAFWIHRKFENAGLLKFDGSYSQNVWISRELTGHNIVGMLPGSHKKQCDRYIIVGAHYDHLGFLDGKMYPGADSNASGTVAMTSLAEMLSLMKKEGRSYGCNIIFVAFDAKEHNMAGSESFWKLIEFGLLKDPVSGKRITKEKIEFMVNIDQIGSTLSPISGRKDFIIMLGNGSLKPESRDNILDVNRFYGLYMDIGLSYYGSDNFTKIFYRLSDQRIFIDNDVPAVYFTSGITMNNNKTYDNASSLNYPVLQKRIYLIYHWIDRMI
jgi:Zn-dependent M28 family amino/carboxypeptidase